MRYQNIFSNNKGKVTCPILLACCCHSKYYCYVIRPPYVFCQLFCLQGEHEYRRLHER